MVSHLLLSRIIEPYYPFCEKIEQISHIIVASPDGLTTYFAIDYLPCSKMGLVDCISRGPQHEAVNVSTYDDLTHLIVMLSFQEKKRKERQKGAIL